MRAVFAIFILGIMLFSGLTAITLLFVQLGIIG